MSPGTYPDQPRSPDIKQRETMDHGFSKGWGFHFPPSEAYWIDSHTHLRRAQNLPDLYELLGDWFVELEAFRLGRILAIVEYREDFGVCSALAEQDPRFEWLLWLPYDRPEIELFKKAIARRCCGLKLHNAPLMRGQAGPEVWHQPRWQEIFALAAESQLPILWHATQRMSSSPYHGGNADAYWGEGQDKGGVNFNNEDLLQVCLGLLQEHPQLKIVGAHQLYLGLDRLSELFEEYPNLYIDTSVGCYLRWADTLYPDDRERLSRFFIDHRDRILFGSDSGLDVGAIDRYLVEGFLCHARFIMHLTLPDTVLQMIAHGNAESLFNLEPMEPQRRGNVRP